MKNTEQSHQSPQAERTPPSGEQPPKPLGLLCLLLIIAFFHLASRCNRQPQPQEIVEILRDTTYIHDTTFIEKPAPAASWDAGQIAATLPLAKDTTDGTGKDTASQPRSQSATEPTESAKPPADSARVFIPITTKVFTDSTTYRATISGYNTTLDRMEIYNTRQYISETRTTSKPPPRWVLGIQAGAGATRNGLTTYIGIGVTYSLLNW